MKENTRAAEFRELYDRQIQRVYKLALLLLGSVADAEDIAQTVFLKVWEKAPKFRDENHEIAWFLTTTRNQCRDLQKKLLPQAPHSYRGRSGTVGFSYIQCG